MRALAEATAAALLVAAAAGSLGALEGRYSATHRLRMLDPGRTSYLAEDVLEIEAIGRRQARISLTSHFVNGHSCTIEGKAKLRRGALLLRERSAGPDGRLCRLVVRREGDRMRWSDGGGSCASYCGMRGSLDGSLPYGSRRAALKVRAGLPPRAGRADRRRR